MKLTKEQFIQFQEALLSAFSSRDELGMMVRHVLDVRLDEVAGGGNLRVTVFRLLEWAESNGRVFELIEGSLQQNPGNSELQQLQKDATTWLSTDHSQSRAKGARSPASSSPISFEWVLVRSGYFFMGDNEIEDYGPQHMVNVPAFHVSRYPVTNAQYAEFADATGHRVPTHWQHGVIPSGKENHPVVKVDWYDALSFCRWAGVRLPTEAEWEKAARGTDGRLFPWGNEPPSERLCNFGMNVGDTTPVDRYPDGISPYGVFDMAGNVLEWTSSGVSPYPYRADDGRENLMDFQMIVNRIVRGGSFSTKEETRLQCTYRWSLATRNLLVDSGDAGTIMDLPVGIDLGFRVAQTLS